MHRGDLVKYTGSLTNLHGLYRLGYGCDCRDCLPEYESAFIASSEPRWTLLADWTGDGFAPVDGPEVMTCVRQRHLRPATATPTERI